MAGFQIQITEMEILATLEGAPASFTPTHTDWMEWTMDYLKTFLDRLQSEIIGDATIGAYTTVCPVVAGDELDRLDINAYLEDKSRMFTIHAPTVSDNPEAIGGPGRMDVLLECVVTAITSKPGYDTTEHWEKALVGDGNPTTDPGVIEMQGHLESLLHNSGSQNLLESGGAPYLWMIEWEAPELDVKLETKKSGVLAYRRVVKGHKWRYNW